MAWKLFRENEYVEECSSSAKKVIDHDKISYSMTEEEGVDIKFWAEGPIPQDDVDDHLVICNLEMISDYEDPEECSSD